MKYRKKLIVIEAMKLEYPTTFQEIIEWCGGKECGVGAVGEKKWIEIETKEGTMRANYGDYIIKEPFDKERCFYPCKPDIFELTYEEIDNQGD